MLPDRQMLTGHPQAHKTPTIGTEREVTPPQAPGRGPKGTKSMQGRGPKLWRDLPFPPGFPGPDPTPDHPRHRPPPRREARHHQVVLSPPPPEVSQSHPWPAHTAPRTARLSAPPRLTEVRLKWVVTFISGPYKCKPVKIWERPFLNVIYLTLISLWIIFYSF